MLRIIFNRVPMDFPQSLLAGCKPASSSTHLTKSAYPNCERRQVVSATRGRVALRASDRRRNRWCRQLTDPSTNTERLGSDGDFSEVVFYTPLNCNPSRPGFGWRRCAPHGRIARLLFLAATCSTNMLGSWTIRKRRSHELPALRG